MSPEPNASKKSTSTGKKTSPKKITAKPIEAKVLPPLDKHSEMLCNYIKAGYPGIYVISPERARTRIMINKIATDYSAKKRNHFVWNAAQGMLNTSTQQYNSSLTDIEEAIMMVEKANAGAIVQIEDLQTFLKKDEPDPILVAIIKSALDSAKKRGCVLIFTGVRESLPKELKHEVAVLDYGLPDAETLGLVLEGVCNSVKVPITLNGNKDQLIEAALGLTTGEAENAFALSLVQSKTLDPKVIGKEKAAVISRSGILEIIDTKDGIDDIGGLDVLKNYLVQRKDAFSKEAKEFGIPSMKGLLIVGVPGTGKSLCSKVAANVFECPLLKLDMGSVFGGTVGESEGNIRHALDTADAIGKCVLWLDEIDKGFSGVGSSNKSDAGTAARVMQTIMTWTSEKTTPVVLMATANDITELMTDQPALFRKGRFDQIFYCDLPTKVERMEIFKIHIRKIKRKISLVTPKVIEASRGYTGAEIEGCIAEALNCAFHDKSELTTGHIITALQQSMPISEQMADSIKHIREVSKGRFRLASTPDNTEETLDNDYSRSIDNTEVLAKEPF